MRWMVMLLLLANIGYAGWYHLTVDVQTPAAVVRSPVPDSLERLQLLEESDAVRSVCMDVGPVPTQVGAGRRLPAPTEKLCETIAP